MTDLFIHPEARAEPPCIDRERQILTLHHGALRRREQGPTTPSIEMAFSKLKALIRKVAARSYEDLWRGVGNVCSLFTHEECYNFFVAAGYQTD